ncbi:short chain dehydrogenase [compost metagenome]
MNLDAEDIARAAWQQAQGAAVHRPVSWLFRLMYGAGQVAPAWVNRGIMKLLSGA